MKQPSLRLVHLLIGKSIAESLLVGTLAVCLFANAFPPYFRGWGEATRTAISGWAVNSSAPWARVEIQLFIDERFVASGVANESRPDVLATGWAKDEWHGYTFMVPSLEVGLHEARVYAVHESGKGARRTLQLLGDPIAFSVDAGVPSLKGAGK